MGLEKNEHTFLWHEITNTTLFPEQEQIQKKYYTMFWDFTTRFQSVYKKNKKTIYILQFGKGGKKTKKIIERKCARRTDFLFRILLEYKSLVTSTTKRNESIH